MQEAYKVARFSDQSLTADETFYWHTLGNARVMKTDTEAGSFAPGKWADFVVLESGADNAVAKLRMQRVQSVTDQLFAWQFFAPNVETWTRGVQRT